MVSLNKLAVVKSVFILYITKHKNWNLWKMYSFQFTSHVKFFMLASYRSL